MKTAKIKSRNGMKVAVVSYSLTGNNEALAKSVAKEFSAEHIKIKESKPRTTSSIILDLIFNRTPQVRPKPDLLENYELILFLGPVWIGNVATPLHAYLKYIKTNPRSYAFISISGGADGANTKLARELKKRAGKEPIALIDMHIADLLNLDHKPARKDTSAYQLTAKDIKSLTNKIVKTLREKIER